MTANNKLFAVTVTANNELFAGTVTANIKLFAVTVTSNNFFLKIKSVVGDILRSIMP